MIKISRTPAAPKSLGKKQRWGNDVIELLYSDFHKKCYICEAFLGLGAGNVEHLLPVCGDKHPEREFDWENLFLSCAHCNLLKGTRLNILDCCKENPEKMIRQKLDGVNKDTYQSVPLTRYRRRRRQIDTSECKVVVTPFDSDNPKACETAKLIQESFSKRNTEFRSEDVDYLLIMLKEEIDTINWVIREYERRKSAGEDVSFELETLREYVQADTQFAGFLRTEVRDNVNIFPEFAELVELNAEHESQKEETGREVLV